MEKLIYVAIAAIVFWSLVGALFAGAVVHLFGVSFWPVAAASFACGLCLGGGFLMAAR